MKLFPTESLDVYSEKGRIVKAKMQEVYTEYNDKNQAYWYQADLDSRFYSGDQTVWDEIYRSSPLRRRNLFSFNRIRRIVQMISGHQRRSRRSTIISPVENGDQQTADQYSKVVSHIHRKGHVLETVSEAFGDALTTGFSLMHVWNDYRQDPVSGSLQVDNLSYNSFLIDPYFKKADLSDCNFLWKRSFLSQKQVVSLLPDKKKLIEDVSQITSENIFTFMPEHSPTDRKNLLSYDEYYYLDSRTQKLLIDTQTGETMEWMSKSEEGMDQFLREFPTVTVEEIEIPTVKLAILVQGTLVFDGINPLGIDSYPFVPVFAYFNPNISTYSLKLQSVVRGLRDAQYLYNRRKNIELDVQESQINSGWIYKENSLVNPDDVFSAGQGKGLALKAEAQMTDVQQIVAPQVPPSMFQLSELMAKEIEEISGVNSELLGSADDDKAGVLSMLRQGAGLTTLQTLFDQLDRSQKILGSKMLSAIQANYTPGKVKRIIEEEPAPQFYNKAFGRYDASVEDGFNTSTQKAQEFSQLIKLKELGVQIPDAAIIEAATLQNKPKLLAEMEKIQQQQAEQQKQAEESQQQLQIAQAELAKAKVQSDLSLAKERDSRVYSNIGLMEERRNEAIKDKTQSMLNLVKTLQEMDNIDLDQLTKMVQLSQVVEGQATQGNNAEQLGSAIVTGATKETIPAPTAGINAAGINAQGTNTAGAKI